jgi:hypothetical protein
VQFKQMWSTAATMIGAQGIVGFLGGMASLAGLLTFKDNYIKGGIDRKKAEADAKKAEAIAANPQYVRLT